MLIVAVLFLAASCAYLTACLIGSKQYEVHKLKELWKTYALSLEITLECLEDLDEEVEGEGCGTRANRLNAIYRQLDNAERSAFRAIDALISAGEYEDA